MTLPKPRVGLVVNYSYLWLSEHRQRAEEGRKDRPCAVVTASQVVEGHLVVRVLPITHSPPRDIAGAVEIPATVKKHLGLDAQRSWVVLTESNKFIWPGVDLRPIPGQPGRFDYGMLPPKLFQRVREGVLQNHLERRLHQVSRDEERGQRRDERQQDRGGRDR